MTRKYDTPGARIRTATHILSRSVDEEIVLYHPSTDAVTHLDAMAAHIWSQLDSGPTLEELVSTLAVTFATDPEIVRADAVAMLDTLLDAQLLQIR